VVTSLVGSHDSGDFSLEAMQAILIRPTVGIYLLVFSVWVVFNVVVLIPRSAAPKGQPWQSGDRVRGLSLGMTAGSISGNMFCVKAFVEICQDSIRQRKVDHWLHWLPYGILAGAIFFALSNLYFLVKAMREYEALFMAAVFEGSLIISACVSGVVVFSEMEKLQRWQVAIYWTSILAIVAGIFVVSLGCKKEEAQTQPEDPLDEGKSEADGEDLEAVPEVEGPPACPPPSQPPALPPAQVQYLCPICQREIITEVGPRFAGFADAQPPTLVRVVGTAVVPLQTHLPPGCTSQPVEGISCLCADGISCFWGLHLARAKRQALPLFCNCATAPSCSAAPPSCVPARQRARLRRGGAGRSRAN